MNDFFVKWKSGLERTRKVTFGKIATIFGFTDISDELWDELEAILIQADVGIETTTEIIKSLKNKVSEEGLNKSEELKNILRYELINRLDAIPDIEFIDIFPAVILIVGVNGSGKTTSIAKIAQYFSFQGKSVLLAAADTFRAAAVDQLQIWGERLKLPVIAGQPNSDPGAVTYDAIKSAISRKIDIVLVDTAGRLHTRSNLMEELKKVYRVIGKALPGAPSAVWLVLDATTGQNALLQAKAFKSAVEINGIILAKLDSSAKGGMAFAIRKELGIPILFAGLGETTDDIELFDREAFVDSMIF